MNNTVTHFNGRLNIPVASGASLTYFAQFFDENEDPIALNALETLTLSIFDDGTVVNSVEDQDILNTDRGTVDSDGKLTLQLLPADTITTEESVDRSLVLDWTYNTDRVGRHEVVFKIVMLSGD